MEGPLEILEKGPKGGEKKVEEDKKRRGKQTITFGGFFGNRY